MIKTGKIVVLFLAGFISPGIDIKGSILFTVDTGSSLHLSVGDELEHESQCKGNIISSKVTILLEMVLNFFNVTEFLLLSVAKPTYRTSSLS